ncbi:MAG: protoporphyrinogen/coproporphyrinogen oxidase [Actinomycetota bacterium]|nr:protoporphyrinogen/coproporphyrinogen oxidase [Actinomycetota bacterium]
MIAARPRHVVVVGGGISGLAAAWFLGPRAPAAAPVRVTVLEGSDQLGGKLRVSDVGGVAVDEGAEALLLRRPEGADLVAAVRAGTLEPARTTAAWLWTRGRLRPLPAGTLMGIPTDLRALARTGVLTPWELARIPWDSWLPATSVGDDLPVGRYVGSRMGRAVVDRLVEPLLGGVYAGHADLLSLDATMPLVAEQARGERSLLVAARVARAAAAPVAGPVFGSLRGGLGQLPEAVATASGATVRTGARVRELRRTTEGWELIVGSAAAPEIVAADAVVLAVPAAPAARLLSAELPAASADLGAVAYASMAIVTLAFPAAGRRLPTGSGYLVPPVDGGVVKAATFTTNKWGWYAEDEPDVRVVRLSVGRLGEEEVLQRDDAELAALALAELREAVGPLPAPIDRRVTRWGGGLPQYAVGHRARVERIRAAVAGRPGLAVCGAAYDGVGVPACVASGGRAAEEVLRHLSHG